MPDSIPRRLGGGAVGQKAETRNSALVLILILLAAAIIRLAFSPSLSGNDDISVAGCALSLLDAGLTLPLGHYCARFGLTLPLAAIFALGGTGTIQISLIPALASLSGILLAWRIGTFLLGQTAGLASAAMLALFPMDIEFAGLAFPDALQGALLAGAMLSILVAKRKDGAQGWVLAIFSGLLWAWAYYVKLDAFIFGGILLVAALLRQVRWAHVIIAGATALLFVGIEVASYAFLTGDPLHRIHLESIAANEVLSQGQDYRALLSYPKAMFILPYEAGLHYYFLLLGIAFAFWKRSRSALLLVSWCLLWQLWLTFGADPFSGFRLKPQLSRYLLSWAIPMAVLGGWAVTLLWARARSLGTLAAAGVLACTAIFAPFNQLSYEAAQATRAALRTAQDQGWFPLYTDVQSFGMATFLLRGRPEAPQLHRAQFHNFLRGVTRFETLPRERAWLLVNENYARRLEARNLVRPIDPASFGLTPTPVLDVNNPMYPMSYWAMHVLVTLARAGAALHVLPSSIHAHLEETVVQVLRGRDVRIWRLDIPD